MIIKNIMPFVNQAQRAACWVKWNEAKKLGKKPKWNCSEWEKHTKHNLCKATCLNGKKCSRSCSGRYCWQHC